MKTAATQSIANLSKFPKTAPCLTTDKVQIDGIGKTKEAVRAYDPRAKEIIDIPVGSVITLGGSMGNDYIHGTSLSVKRVELRIDGGWMPIWFRF